MCAFYFHAMFIACFIICFLVCIHCQVSDLSAAGQPIPVTLQWLAKMGRVKNKISSRSLRLGNFTGARGSSGEWSRARRATTVAQLARRESAFVLMSRQASIERRPNSSESSTTVATASARPPGKCCSATDDGLAEGLNKLRARKMQDGGAEESRWNTWRKLYRRWYGNSLPLPVTVESLEEVCSLLLSGRYRSGTNDLGAAKKMHIKAGFEWTSLLELTA